MKSTSSKRNGTAPASDHPTIAQLQDEITHRKRLEDDLVNQIDSLEKKLDRRTTQVRTAEKLFANLCKALLFALECPCKSLMQVYNDARCSWRDGDLGRVEDAQLAMPYHLQKLATTCELLYNHRDDTAAILDKHGAEMTARNEQLIQDLRTMDKPSTTLHENQVSGHAQRTP